MNLKAAITQIIAALRDDAGEDHVVNLILSPGLSRPFRRKLTKFQGEGLGGSTMVDFDIDEFVAHVEAKKTYPNSTTTGEQATTDVAVESLNFEESTPSPGTMRRINVRRPYGFSIGSIGWFRKQYRFYPSGEMMSPGELKMIAEALETVREAK